MKIKKRAAGGQNRYIIGRDKELNLSLSTIKGKPPYPVLFFAGEGGSGKTTLLNMIKEETESQYRFNPVFVDCKNCLYSDLWSFTKLLAESAEIKGNPYRAWNAKSYPGNTLLLVDTFEMMGPQGDAIAKSLSGLAEAIPVIMAGRKAPATGKNMKVVQLQPFNRQMVELYLKNAGLPAEIAPRAFSFSGGNPLLLSLFAMAAAKSDSPAAIDRDLIQSDYVSFLVSEVTGENVFTLLEAASIVHSFDRDLLSHMVSHPVPDEDFARLSRLSFVSRNKKSWQVHDVVSHSIRSSLKKYAPKQYYHYKKKALGYYYLQEQKEEPRDKKDIYLHRIYLCEDDFARRIFFNLGNDSTSELTVTPPTEDDFSRVVDVWKVSSRVLGFSEEQVDAATEDTENLLRYARPYFRMLKDKNRNIVGYHATVPACRTTMGYFLHSPATSSYFNSLPRKELNHLCKIAEHETDTYFIRHFVPINVNDPAVLSGLLQDLTKRCLRDGVRIVTTTPHSIYRALVSGLGFRKIPGIYDTAFTEPVPAYELDFRHASIELWYEWLAVGRYLPHWLYTLVTCSKQFWREQVNELLNGLDDDATLSRHALAPLAAELLDAGNNENYTPGALNRELAIKIINELDPDQAGILAVTFLQAGSREQAAQQLNLSTSTYYRKLKQARQHFSDMLFEKATLLARKKYVNR